MDTFAARLQMRDLARDALTIVQGLSAGNALTRNDRSRLREMMLDARTLLGDAGFPGEASWRGIQRASIGAETSFDQPDHTYWADVASDLSLALETLNNLVSVARRDSDIHIVG